MSPIKATSLRLDVVRSGKEFVAIGPAWMQLWTEVDGLVFQSHQWVAAWWNTLPANHRYSFRIGLVWDEERLIAVFPLVVCRRKGVRFLEWAAISCTDYPDILCAADCSIDTLWALWAKLEASGGFDVVQLLRLLPDARARQVIGALSASDSPRNELNYRVVGDFSGPGGWLSKQSKKARQNYRRGRQVLEDLGTVTFRLVDPAIEPIIPLVQQFERLKRAWLVGTHKQSELLEDNAGAAQALISVLAEQHILRAFVLEIDGRPVAISFNFEQHGALMALLTTFDPAFEKASPGMLLIADYIQWAADHGLRVVDFLCGAEGFKNRFATESILLESKIAPRSLLGQVALGTHGLLRRLRVARAVRAARTIANASSSVTADALP